MKVLSYLGACDLLQHEQVTYFQELNRRFKFTGTISEFFSQSFKPELITELFEGWRKHEEYKGIYDNDTNDERIKIRWFEVYHYQYLSYYSYRKANCMFIHAIIPRTLDDFITDCQRAGIELKWRLK